MKGTLYLVGTPIGNRADLAPRVREVLGRVAATACEDTRTCRRLYAWLKLPVPRLIAYHEHNVDAALPKVLERLLCGDDVALVSEAGMPAIQDPGFRLVVVARRQALAVIPVPGPSAFVLALAASGLPTDRFAFLGFAPRRSRATWWGEALARPETVVVYEAPGRVSATARVIADLDATRPVCLARELTKVHEEFVAGAAGEVAGTLAARAECGEPLRGECVLVVGGAADRERTEARSWREALEALRVTRAGRSLSPRDLVDVLSCAYPGARKAIYRAAAGRSEAE